MAVVGLTGRIGAGKSTVAAIFARHGAVVIDADVHAHAVLDEPEVRRALATRFGPAVIDAAGSVHRAALARCVFGPGPDHARALADLEALVHPRVRERIAAALAAAPGGGAAGSPPVVVLDVPLLAGSGLEARCDLVVVVECDSAVRRRRLIDRGLTPSQISARDAAWERSARRAGDAPWALERTRVVDTSGDLSYTELQVERIWGDLHRMAARSRCGDGPSPDTAPSP